MCNYAIGQEVTLKEQQPNIIFILVDDMGYGDVGRFFQNERRQQEPSSPWLETPALDKMAENGAIFTQHYTSAPVCAPSRASLLTGLSQGQSEIRDNQFDKALPDNHTLGSVLQKAGYHTAVIGKWGLQGIVSKENENPQHWPAYPTKRGFDYFYGYVRHRDGHEHYPVEGIFGGSKEVWENNKEVSAGLEKAYTTDLWTAVAKKWITQKAQKNKKPFFLYLSYDTPHAVLELPTQAYPEGGGLNGGIQFLGTPGKMINTASGTPDSWTEPVYAEAVYDHDQRPETAPVPWPATYKRYATSIRRIDRAVGDIIKLLQDLEIDSNTIVVFASDNGPSIESYLPAEYAANQANFFDSFGPYNGIKRDVLEGGLRTPLIVQWPEKIAKNRIIKSPSIFYDWLPTFTDAAGLPAPVNSNGTSLLPAFIQEGKVQQGNVYVEYFQNGSTPAYPEFAASNRGKVRNQMQMLRVGDMVGLRYNIQSHDDDFEIYNVTDDPAQSKNLAKSTSYKGLQEKMKAKVLQMRRINSSAPRPYDSVPIPSVKGTRKKKGLIWKSYDGKYPWLPKTEDLKVAAKGTVKEPNFNEIKEMGHDIFLFEGFLDIPEDGKYEFYLNANSNYFLKLHEINLIDGDHNFKEVEIQEAQIFLQKGLHPFKLYYKNKKNEKPQLELEWKIPKDSKNVISSKYFFRS
ncbi:sulfatase-like hydrolase/transferase [Salinimicrobium tongyeongense]|uniref:Sulfatase-like hydrolase/transferase n=1 Tax=Salinimicrobium tongyeongense TaxID=2809707 RepID=A0ABY6NRY6_9FLAO|nr:sulfatase-like hydrolase/transferase [Salinimicrobium tongyeongense]UZH55421.1 sulfatase-like hydrolase/transferase [Salinimicrobium tongyeongense]